MRPQRHPPAILVVDDEPSIRLLLTCLLAEGGFSVQTASGGPEAVDLFRRQPGLFNLVLLDVFMPCLDGPATLAALREIDPDVRCCFFTAYSGRHNADDLLALGAERVFEKPFHLGRLLADLQALLA